MEHKLKIVFMGTPEFAVPSLKVLSETENEISLVVTQPDRPKGRGRKLAPPPVKTAAEKAGLKVLQPESVKSKDFFNALISENPDLLVVTAFGHILSQEILEMPRLGAVNVHASLLPKYRGPAPIQWAIINGEEETGVTTMLMDSGLDTGDILLKSRTAVRPAETAGELHDRLAAMGGELLRKTVEGLKACTLEPAAQDSLYASYAPMLKKSDGRIDWSLKAEEIERKIRGMNPWPLAHTFFNGRRLNIFKADVRPATSEAAPGTVLPGFSGELRVAAGKGALSILEIQAQSGKRLDIRDFLAGSPIPPGSILG